MPGDVPNSEGLEASDAGGAAIQNGGQPPPQIPDSISESNPPPSPNGGSEPHKPDRDWLDYVKFAVEVVGLGFLIAYTVYAGLSWREMRKSTKATQDSVDLARKNAHFDQRAWLGISFGTYKYTVNETFGAAYDVIDTGRTPARNVHGFAVTRFMKTGETPSFNDVHGTSMDSGTMLQNVHQGAISWLVPSSVRKEEPVQAIKISDEMFRALHTGSGYIMIYGTINYDSVFGAHHWIKFCATSGPTFFTQPKECIDYNDVDNNEEP